LVKGYQAPPETATALPGEDSAAEKRAAAIEPAERPKSVRKPKPRVAKRKPARITVKSNAQPAAAPQQQQTQGAPWPAPAQQQPQQASGAQSPWPATTQQPSTAPWPSAPPPGSFSR